MSAPQHSRETRTLTTAIVKPLWPFFTAGMFFEAVIRRGGRDADRGRDTGLIVAYGVNSFATVLMNSMSTLPMSAYPILSTQELSK